jgi:hypothetical protein
VKKTIICDFDGVIHSYLAWKGLIPTDPPVPGVREALILLRKHYYVKILSTRCMDEGGVEAIEAYMLKHDIPHDGVIREKEKAVLMIDDRGYRFDGDWTKLLEFVKDGVPEPWNRPQTRAGANLKTFLETPVSLEYPNPRGIGDVSPQVVEPTRQAEIARYRTALHWLLAHGFPTIVDDLHDHDYLAVLRRHVQDTLDGKDVGGVEAGTYRETDGVEC